MFDEVITVFAQWLLNILTSYVSSLYVLLMFNRTLNTFLTKVLFPLRICIVVSVNYDNKDAVYTDVT